MNQMNTIDDIVYALNKGCDMQNEQLDFCKVWLLEFQLANQMTFNELCSMYVKYSNWFFDQIFDSMLTT